MNEAYVRRKVKEACPGVDDNSAVIKVADRLLSNLIGYRATNQYRDDDVAKVAAVIWTLGLETVKAALIAVETERIIKGRPGPTPRGILAQEDERTAGGFRPEPERKDVGNGVYISTEEDK